MTENSLLKPIHPGEILREEFMAPHGLTSNALALKLGVTAARISEIVREKRGITADTALRLSRFFTGTRPEEWLNFQRDYDLECALDAAGADLDRIPPLLSQAA